MALDLISLPPPLSTKQAIGRGLARGGTTANSSFDHVMNTFEELRVRWWRLAGCVSGW